ncbi:hypothetical protein BMETH_388_2 [methanotrophic bacterial endosymbiont of Bathymodiolus sp.]|nr:hypothetical protein BMETH_388_2 [methanotrophic bacterial endosymbiont of Bathymodiolus sp.]
MLFSNEKTKPLFSSLKAVMSFNMRRYSECREIRHTVIYGKQSFAKG